MVAMVACLIYFYILFIIKTITFLPHLGIEKTSFIFHCYNEGDLEPKSRMTSAIFTDLVE